MPAELVRRAEKMTGARVAIGFGQTEASPYLTHTLPDDPHPAWSETVGRPLPRTEVKVVDPASGTTLPLGEAGEICARGYGIMTGYFDDPAGTAAALDEDGWLHTGDVGSMDGHGYLRISGRLRDLIIRGGENVYPKEIEDVLFAHPEIVSAAVVGLPDPDLGERVAACVQVREGATATAETLAAFCRERLARYKVPISWHFMDEFPQTASGKIQKFVLRERISADAGSISAES